MEFLGEVVEGELTEQKIRREILNNQTYIPPTVALHVIFKNSKSGRNDRHRLDPFCVFCESQDH